MDLNLLRVFMAIWDLRSLTAAAERLGLTQSAISHSLRRLREHFDDPLFVRSSNLMLPTEAAVRLHAPLDTALNIINHAVQDHLAFDPAKATRTFRIAMSDISEAYLLADLMEAVLAEAPLAQIDVVPLAIETIAGSLRAGEVDLAIGFVPQIDDSCISWKLLQDRFIFMVRRDHPIVATGITPDRFSSLRYVHVGASAPGYQLVDERLNQAGMLRPAAVRVGHFIIAPDVVKRTDLAVIFPESMGERANRHGEFQLMPLPFDMPSIEVMIHIHKRFANDMGVNWLADLIRRRFST